MRTPSCHICLVMWTHGPSPLWLHVHVLPRNALPWTCVQVFWNVTRDTFPYSDLMDPSQFIVALPELRQKVEEYGWAVSNGQSTQGMEVGGARTLPDMLGLSIFMLFGTQRLLVPAWRNRCADGILLPPIHPISPHVPTVCSSPTSWRPWSSATRWQCACRWPPTSSGSSMYSRCASGFQWGVREACLLTLPAIRARPRVPCLAISHDP